MLQAGLVKVTCDSCGRYKLVSDVDYVPQGWYALLKADHTRIPGGLQHLCSEECVISTMRHNKGLSR